MRIGLAGVPGSGKTALAESLKVALAEIDPEKYGTITVIDNYVEDLEQELDLALGWAATYVGNLQVVFEREAKERIAKKDSDATITCGTLFETASYVAQSLENEYRLLTKNDEAERKDLVIRAESVTRILACLYIDTIRYDHIFYLPPMGEISDVRAKDLEKNLQAAFNAFELFPVTALYVDGDNPLEITENRLKAVLKEVISADNAEEQDVQTQESD
jgi:hypothetical protein